MANAYKYVKASIQRRRDWINSLKRKPCEGCGSHIQDPSELDWHHKDPYEKGLSIGRGSFREGRQKLLEEIAKCLLLCKECHRTAHRLMRVCCGQDELIFDTWLITTD
jgi:hypothetical protein